MGYESYFKYVTRDKKDNSEVIKKLILSLNSKIDARFREEQLRVYEYYNRRSDPENKKKITTGDMQRYVKIHSNTRVYDKYVVLYYLFKLLERYFGIGVRRYDPTEGEDGAGSTTDNTFGNFKGFDLYLTEDTSLLGRLYIDIEHSETKTILDPISIKVSDRMLIGDGIYTVPEVVLLGNYPIDGLTSTQVVQLFREFGYVIQELCYRSGVGLVNRDPEFSNYMPLIMENIAWDRDTILSICEDPAIVDHIIAMRHFDICTLLKRKCINAQFDHLIQQLGRGDRYACADLQL